MAEIRRNTCGSLRARMILGSLLMAGPAVAAAGAMLYAGAETSRRLEAASSADRRIELYGALSGRVNDYALVALEISGSAAVTDAQRRARLSRRREEAHAAFERAALALGDHVALARDDITRNRRATRSLGLARMRAQFGALSSAVEGEDPSIRARLDGFATQFAPLLDASIREEKRERIASLNAIETLRDALRWIAGGVAALTLLAVALFYTALIAPLLRRTSDATRAARAIGQDISDARLPTGRRDELGLLFAHVNRVTARLERRRCALERDRAALNETVAQRTLALRSANETLETIDSNRRRFFSDVGHELRTPLTVILSEAEIGMRAADMNPEGFRASRDVIHKRARRLNRRIEDLLRVARSETGRIELEQSVFDMAAAARGAISDSERLASQSGVTLRADLPEASPTLGDMDWTRQVISGLLENAVRHSPDGGIILLRGAVTDEMAQIEITDEGAGVAPEALERVFRRFERGEKRAGAGFGVGLALARWVMDRQGGELVMKSPALRALSDPPKGSGASVIASLPLLSEDGEP